MNHMIRFLVSHDTEIFLLYELVLLGIWLVLLAISVWVYLRTTNELPWWCFIAFFIVLGARRVVLICYHLGSIEPETWTKSLLILDTYAAPMVNALLMLCFFLRLVYFIKRKSTESIVKMLSFEATRSRGGRDG